MFGVILFGMIATGALGVVFAVMSKGRTFGSAAGPLSACVAVAAFSLWLAYLCVKSVVRRIKEAQQIALAGRAIWEASFRAETERGAGTSGAK